MPHAAAAKANEGLAWGTGRRAKAAPVCAHTCGACMVDVQVQRTGVCRAHVGVVHTGVLSAVQSRPSAQDRGDRQTPGPWTTSCKCPPGLATHPTGVTSFLPPLGAWGLTCISATGHGVSETGPLSPEAKQEALLHLLHLVTACPASFACTPPAGPAAHCPHEEAPALGLGQCGHS